MRRLTISKITEETGTYELAHNCTFIRDGETWYRDFDNEIRLRDMMRETIKNHSQYDEQYDDDEILDEILFENLMHPAGNDIDGLIAVFNMLAWSHSNLRERLKAYEDTGLTPEQVQELAERDTATVTYTTGSGKNRMTHTRTEHYWTWDEIDSESKHSKELMFCGIKFPYKKIDIPETKHIDTISTGYHLRDVYYGTKAKHKGTIFTKLKDGTISDKSSFYKEQKAEEAKERLTKGEKSWLIVFWVAWIVVIVACVIGFCYFRNDWLEE